MKNNTADAEGDDSSGAETVSDDTSLTTVPGITIDRLQTNGRRLTVRLTNLTGDLKTIDGISIEWPSGNRELSRIRLDEATVWQGEVSPPSATLDGPDSGWSGGTLVTGEAILRFDFGRKSANSGYTVRLDFTDGTSLLHQQSVRDRFASAATRRR